MDNSIYFYKQLLEKTTDYFRFKINPIEIHFSEKDKSWKFYPSYGVSPENMKSIKNSIIRITKNRNFKPFFRLDLPKGVDKESNFDASLIPVKFEGKIGYAVWVLPLLDEINRDNSFTDEEKAQTRAVLSSKYPFGMIAFTDINGNEYYTGLYNEEELENFVRGLFR